MKITLLGAGNMAWQLGAELSKHPQLEIEAIYSRDHKNAQALSQHIGMGKATDQLALQDLASDLFILCVSDQAYEEVIQQLTLPEHAIITHTSGSHPLTILDRFAARAGVFYPFQTMSKHKPVDFQQIPICIESKHPSILDKLQQLGELISPKVHQVSSEARKKLHLSAVFACNFANHMWAIAEKILNEHQMSFELLEHLVAEIFEKSRLIGPSQSQTGPAIRHDENIIQSHLTALENQQDFQKIYEVITRNIQEFER